MDRPLTPADVLGAKPGAWDLLKRGMRKHCPRCDGGHVYDTWLRMKARCPTCGYLFEREPGFFIGAYFVNFVVTEGILFAVMIGYIILRSTNASSSWLLPLVLGLGFAVAAPLAFYPFSRTIWSAIDLAMTPLDLHEIVAAEDAVHPLDEAAPRSDDDDDGAPDAHDQPDDPPAVAS